MTDAVRANEGGPFVARLVTRAAVLGTGLIGGSVGAALRGSGTEVIGFDHDAHRAADAVARGLIDAAAPSPAAAVAGCELAFVAVPVGATAELAIAALDADPEVVVTDVGSAKGAVVDAIEAARPAAAARFVGGHPMAGSEQDGIDGARADLFTGAIWVLTPTDRTAAVSFALVRGVVAAFGAEAIALAPRDHDRFVSTVSHVPQLAASTLMVSALEVSAQHATLLRLAAGGFRDMTRVAAGNPAIWPDILTANRDAVLAALDRYVAALGDVRRMVLDGDRVGLLTMLQRARQGRRTLPIGAAAVDELVELHVPVPDRPGVLAEITTLAGRWAVNVYDLEIAHSLEGDEGVMTLVVAAGDAADAFEAGLRDLGYAVSRGKFE
jgi:prephenate dehydrogenase